MATKNLLDQRNQLLLEQIDDTQNQIDDAAVPVSYTHLDVYKRQVLDMVHDRLKANAVPIQLPIGKEDTFKGCLLYTSRCV